MDPLVASNTNTAASTAAAPASLLPADTNAIAQLDIRPEHPPQPIPSFWVWLGGLGLLTALALAAWYAWRRYRAGQKRVPPAAVVPPYRRALDRLRAALDLMHDPERFCVVVSDAVRWYLEERFQLRAPERTTEEFLAELRGAGRLSDLQQSLLGDFLTRCDLVKFARHQPSEPELRALHDAAVRLVEETEPLLNPQAFPPPVPPVPAPAAAR
jgi:hypothetical protein